MVKVYHYTSKENYQKIIKSGYLLPLSWPFGAGDLYKKYAPKSIQRMMPYKGYVVGMPSESLDSWKDSGLLEKIISHFPGKVLIKFKLGSDKRAFLREAHYLSSQYMRKECGIDLWDELKHSRISLTQFSCRKPYREYIKSTISLSEYTNEFVIPEIWIPKKISIDELVVVNR